MRKNTLLNKQLAGNSQGTRACYKAEKQMNEGEVIALIILILSLILGIIAAQDKQYYREHHNQE